MRRQFLLVVLMVMAMVMAACGPDRSGREANSDNVEDQTKPEKLTIWANENENEFDVIEGLTKKFTEETGIEVEVVPLAMDDQTQTIGLDAPAGKGPDLFYQPGVGALAVQGLVQPVQVEQEVLDRYTPESIEALSYEGELYGLPAVVETYALYYNKDIIKEEIETIEDLNNLAKEHTDASKDEFGFLYDATNFYFTYAFMSGYDGYVFGQEEGVFNTEDIGLANEGSIKAGKLLASWFDNGYMPRQINMDIVSGLFSEGKVGAVINGPWALTEYKEALGDKLAVTYLPKLENGNYPRSFIGVKGWMLSEYSENPYWASSLAAFMTNDESAKEYFETTGEIPPNLTILNDSSLQNDELLAGFLTQLTRGEAFPNVASLSEVWEPMADALYFISQGEDPKESLEEGVEFIKQNIEMTNN
ncbi:MAG: extracellular solute-binding protein [Bacillota bacterium]